MAYFIASENLQGKYEDSGNTILIVKYDFEVDTESDLPAQNQFSSDGVKIAMTSTAHVISNNKRFEMQSDGTWSDITTSSGGGGGGATVYLTADNIAYDNTTSGLTADDVQEALDEIVSEMPVIPSTYDADDINYDNTTSGLSATNVQDALDEIVSDIPSIPSTYDADDIVYDNTTSGMTATNVQDAIDELNTGLSGKQDTLTFDNTPTQSSTNPVTSDGIYTALSGKQDTLTYDNTPTQNSTNPVTSDGIYTALAGKQNTLTFDTTPTQGSNNPVTSDGIYAAIQGGGGGGSDVDTLHNGCFRGKYLGDSITAEQLNAIYTGTFDDIYVGDYWTLSGVNWRVADINYYIGYSNNVLPTDNHIILFPDTILAKTGWNQSDTSVFYNNPSYVESKPFNWLTNNSSSYNFGSKLSTNHQLWYCFSGTSYTVSPRSVSMILPNAMQIFGANFMMNLLSITPEGFASRGMNATKYSAYTSTPQIISDLANKQFALFRYTSKYIDDANGETYWLRDTMSGGGSSGNLFVVEKLSPSYYKSVISFISPTNTKAMSTAGNNGYGIRPYYIMKGIPLPD